MVVAPFLISQCYNNRSRQQQAQDVVAPFLISQCYNIPPCLISRLFVVAPFLISQCYNTPTGDPYYVRVSRFICSKKMGLK